MRMSAERQEVFRPSFAPRVGDETAALRVRVARLEAAVAVKDEEIRRLTEDLEPSRMIAYRLGLTPIQATMLAVILTRTVARRETVETAIWGLADEIPETSVLKVHLCRIRKKLAPHGVEIETLHGIGWSMSPEAKLRLAAAVGVEGCDGVALRSD